MSRYHPQTPGAKGGGTVTRHVKSSLTCQVWPRTPLLDTQAHRGASPGSARPRETFASGCGASALQTHWPPARSAPRFSSPEMGTFGGGPLPLSQRLGLKSPGHPFQAREAPSRREARALGLFSAAGDLGSASDLFGSRALPFLLALAPTPASRPGSRDSTCRLAPKSDPGELLPAPPSYRSQGAGRWAGTRSQPRGVRRGAALPAAAPRGVRQGRARALQRQRGVGEAGPGSGPGRPAEPG